MKLASPLLNALRDNNYNEPSPIQAQAIPLILEGNDILGAAQTGTGKTAAFALPILDKLHNAQYNLKKGQMKALVLAPTRELAEQISESFKKYGKHLSLRCMEIYGGTSQGKQVRKLERGIDVVIATPGRLLDLHNQGYLDFSAIDFFILDEVDRMLDMGFINDIKKILRNLPKNRQSLFFSATINEKISQLASSILTDPANVRIAPKEKTADNVDHSLCFLQNSKKPELLQHLLKDQDNKEGKNLTIVFSRTKHGADKISKALKKSGIKAEAIHGNKSQASRTKALANFKSGRSSVLIATDVAARGIDVKDVTMVVNYDLPDDPEAYVHRIGRTARGGNDGVALSFFTSDKVKELKAIERLIKKPISSNISNPFHCEDTESKRNNSSRSIGSNNKPGKRNFRKRTKSSFRSNKKASFA